MTNPSTPRKDRHALKQILRESATLLVFVWVALWAGPPMEVRAEVVDRIVAVVAHHIILASELETQVIEFAISQRLDISTGAVRDSLAAELLDQMVNDRLMLIQAERDTTIKASDHTVESQLDDHLKRIQSQFPSPEDFYKQLAREGMTIAELKRKYRREVRDQILKNKLIESRIRSVDISAPEVDMFYAQYKDSLPAQVAAVHLLDIRLAVEPSDATRDSIQTRAQAVLDTILAGADFEAMARRYSGDPSGKDGGDLGSFGRGAMVPEFEKVAFGLAVGEISGVVETAFGYHIIKSLGRDRGQVHAAHILFRVFPSARDLEMHMKEAQDIRTRLVEGEDFGSLAKEFSGDSATASLGGDLGWIPLTVLPEPFNRSVGQYPAGTFLDPVGAEDGIHIVKIEERRDDRPFDLNLDRKEITEMARRHKTGEVVEEWVAQLRSEIYVDVRL